MNDKTEESFESNDNTLNNVSIEDLFDSSRLHDKEDFIKFIIYFPFGVILLLLRLIIAFTAFLIFPLLPWNSYRSFIFKSVCKILGLVIQHEDKYLNKNNKILIANHVSIIDRIAINFVVPSKKIINNFHLNDINIISFWKDGDAVHFPSALSNDEIRILKRYIEDSPIPILDFPEEATTNGKIGVLKFNPNLFSLNFPIQPVSIKVSLPPLFIISPSTLGSKTWSDILWLFFIPCTYFSLKILPSMEKLPEESAFDFSKRVQQAIASSLNLIPTNYTSKDKYELVQRLKSPSTLTTSSGNISEKNPLPSLHRDLSAYSQSGLKFVPNFNTSAKKFGKSPKERMQSYQERKAVLIESARIKYLEKHGLLKSNKMDFQIN